MTACERGGVVPTSLIKTPGLRGGESCPNSRSWEVAQPDLNPDLSDSQLLAFPLHSSLVVQVGAEGQG